ncbi:MFS transporter [Corynebacterium sphenisci]|uniref:MFS transporter n=1 Tax=Corynebacterium sphenisci TaxID=191493 RepID=UPI0026DFB3AA|nr:MFS transporter [Corynebacterium sphenisci]MDO5731420.1 MFS transporter [Corynebacterium sphenisci]
MAPEIRRAVPANTRRLIAAQGLQSAGDQVVDAKTVLPWLLNALGAPGFMLGLLVPIRESGSMLPQAALTPWVRAQPRRKRVWLIGALTQAAMAALIAVAAAAATGAAAGALVLLGLAGFSLGRSLCSIGSKDIQGRVIPKGRRGRVSGVSTMVGGIAAITVGAAVRILGGSDRLGETDLEWLIGAAALAWVAGAAVFARIAEPAAEAEDPGAGPGWVRESLDLLREDRPFRRFVVVRALLLVSALAPAFLVTLAARGGAGLGGLGTFLIASGAASIIGGRISGRFSDRSSRRAMILGAAAASAVILAALALARLAPGAAGWALPVTYFLLALTHTEIRVARKTYVVDMATGDRRTSYVAVGNTAMGVILLFTGVISGALAHIGVEWALLLLAGMGLAGVAAARALPEVSRPETAG